MYTRFTLACLLLTLVCAPPARAGVIAMTDQSAWLAALPGSAIQRADFDGPRRDFAADSVNALDGIRLELRGGGLDPGPTGPTGDGFLRGELDASGDDALALLLHLPDTRGVALLGLQNDSARSPANLDLAEIAIAIDEQQWILSELLGEARGAVPFIGFVADAPFAALTLFHAGAISNVRRSSENFHLDGLAVAVNATAVPEPAPLALLFGGLLGLWIGRSRLPARRGAAPQITAATASTKVGICAARRPAMLMRLSPVM